MRSRQLAWFGAIAVALGYLLVAAYLAYDSDALGDSVSRLVRALAWASATIVAVANLLGIAGAVRASSSGFATGVINSLAGRIALLALSLALGTAFLVLALRASPPRRWSCRVTSTSAHAPDLAHCPTGATFARLQRFALTIARTDAAGALPTVRARVVDRARAAVAIDSSRGGLCAATGPDRPTYGESRLALGADCGVDGIYPVNVHVCEVQPGDASLPALVTLEIEEDGHAVALACE